MRQRTWIWLWVIVVVVGGLAAGPLTGQQKAAGEEYVGTWLGTWEGSGSGTLELTLEKDTAGAITGKLAVTGEPNYTVTFKSLEFDGNKMAAKYDFPPDESAEVVIGATFEGNTASGTWSAREKASGNEVVAGTWSVKKKS